MQINKNQNTPLRSNSQIRESIKKEEAHFKDLNSQVNEEQTKTKKIWQVIL